MIYYQEDYLEKSAITEQHRSEPLKRAAAYEQVKLRAENETQEVKLRLSFW